jgi:hypothetical protein
MLYGLTGATVVGLSSILVYGTGASMAYAWVEPLFWTLIAVGALMGRFEESVNCKLCAMREWLLRGSARCESAPCLAPAAG